MTLPSPARNRGFRSTVTLIALAFMLVIGAVSAQKITLNVLMPGGDQPGQKETIATLVAPFEAAHPNIEVKFQSVGWDEAYQKISTSLLAGDAPDILYVGARWIAPFSQLGGLTSLEDYADQAKRDSFPSGALQGNMFKGKLMGLPVAFSTKALYYRTDLIATPPTTWDELLADAQKVTADDPSVFGIGLPGAAHVSTTGQFFTFLYQAGGQVFDDQGNVALDSEAGIKALTYYTDFFTKYHVTPNPIEYNREQLPTLFKQGKIAMMINGPWGKSIMGVEPDNADVPYATAVLPCGERCGGIQVGDSVTISKDTKHPDEAWAFIDYWTSLEAHTQYDLDGGLVPMVTGEQSNPAFQSAFWQPYLDMIADGFPQPQPLAWEPFQTIITDMIQNVLLGKATPEEALKTATKAIEDQNLQPSAAGQ